MALHADRARHYGQVEITITQALEVVMAELPGRSRRSDRRSGLRKTGASVASAFVPEKLKPLVVSDIMVDEATALAQEAFLFGAPLILTSIQADYLAQVTEPTRTPSADQPVWTRREFVDASDRTVVGFNVDNLYSFAVVDVTDGADRDVAPPQWETRYWIMQVIDAWNGVPAAPGSRQPRRQRWRVPAHRPRLRRRGA